MAFKMTCPKCGSYDYSVERDRRIRTLADPAAGLIFSCRCGKQLFGSLVVDEHKRQLKAWEAGRAARQVARADEVSHSHTGANHAHADEDTAPEPASRGWMDGSASRTQTEEAGEGERCSWHMCSKRARPGSKYCSRACSNKNARYRYKQRKSSDREAA